MLHGVINNYMICDRVDFSRPASHRYPTDPFMSISWRASPTAVRKQSVCSLGSDLADVCNSNRWNQTQLLPLPVQALSCGYSRFYHHADTLPSQQLSPCDPPPNSPGHESTVSWTPLMVTSLTLLLCTAVVLASPQTCILPSLITGTMRPLHVPHSGEDIYTHDIDQRFSNCEQERKEQTERCECGERVRCPQKNRNLIIIYCRAVPKMNFLRSVKAFEWSYKCLSSSPQKPVF